MVLLSSLAWMSTNHHPLEEAAYQFDSAKLGSEGQIPYRTLFLALLLAFAVLSLVLASTLRRPAPQHSSAPSAAEPSQDEPERELVSLRA